MINGSTDWESFKNSTQWQDICEEIDIWIEEIRNQLESEEVDLGEVKALRGSARALRHVKGLPENLKQLALDREQEEKNDNE